MAVRVGDRVRITGTVERGTVEHATTEQIVEAYADHDNYEVDNKMTFVVWDDLPSSWEFLDDLERI